MLFSDFDLERIELSADCISGFNNDMKIMIWNGSVERKYKIHGPEALGRSFFQFFPHVKDDFRVKCFMETIRNKKSFYFQGLPYLYDTGIYTQLILPVQWSRTSGGALSIVRDHAPGEIHSQDDLLKPILR